MSVIRPSADGFRYFAQWAGNPKGVREDKARCAFEVWSNETFPKPYQCQRKRVVGDYCKQHAKRVNL
jgi:hypothetical protein